MTRVNRAALAYAPPVDEARIRPAGRSDVAGIERLMADAFGRYIERIGRPPAPMSADYAAALDTSRVWVVEADGAVVAALVTENRGDHLLLDAVAVASAAQGRGFGARLLARAEQDARELGLPEIRLCTNQAMTENLVYYPRHGYTETGRGRQDGYDRVFFAKRV
jgi:N-acetylglutamate synthase-like GNAT family acetyltransferase